MIKNLKFYNYLILLLPLGFITGPLILEILLFLIAALFFFEVKKKFFFELIKNFFFKIFFCFSIYLILSFLIFSRYNIGYTYSLFFIRYGFYFLAIVYFISKNLELKKLLLITFLIINLLVAIDAITQFIFGSNILGFKIQDTLRISGVFGKELILGSYLTKTSIFLFTVIFFFEKNYFLKFTALSLIVINFILIFLSGERSALFLFIIYCFLLFLILDVKIKYKFIFSSLIILLTSITLITNQNVYKRIFEQTIFDLMGPNNLTKNFYNSDQLIIKNYDFDDCVIKKNLENKECFYKKKFYFFSATHQNYFVTSFNIFKNHILFGSGPKTYRVLCKNEKYFVNRWSCSSHPHNYYFQLLAETGIIGLSILIIAYLSIIIKIIKIRFDKNLNANYKNYYLVLLGGLFINFFPIVPTGNFFNNWLLIISLMPIIFILDYKNEPI